MSVLTRYLSTTRRADALRSPLVPVEVRARALRLLGMDIAEDACIESHVHFLGTDVVIGRRTFINRECFFDQGPIRLGDDVALGPGVTLASGGHEIGPPTRRAGHNTWGAIVIENGCWIGTRAVILAGTTIAPGCVIAAGALVRSDTEPHGLYAGTPARRIRDLPTG